MTQDSEPCLPSPASKKGSDPQWVQLQLGHSDPGLTLNVYGQWSDAAKRTEAGRASGFPV
jgi:integrase